MSCLETTNQQAFCVTILFTSVSVTNEYDCPILTLSDTLTLIPANQVLRSVSILHLCNSDCKFVIDDSFACSIEHNIVTVSNCLFNIIIQRIFIFKIYILCNYVSY